MAYQKQFLFVALAAIIAAGTLFYMTPRTEEPQIESLTK
jgi:HAMP domain-containing protein